MTLRNEEDPISRLTTPTSRTPSGSSEHKLADSEKAAARSEAALDKILGEAVDSAGENQTPEQKAFLRAVAEADPSKAFTTAAAVRDADTWARITIPNEGPR